MSLVNLLFGTRAPGPADIGGFEMDVTVSERHSRTSQITTSPIEDGSRAADHIILDPESVIIEGFVTSAPAQVLPIGVFGDAGTLRVIDAFDKLDQLWAAREPIDLITGYQSYENMVIVDLDLPREREIGLRFTAELQKIRVIQSEIAGLPGTLAEDVEDSAAPTIDAGRQPTNAASGGSESFLFQLLDRLP